MAKVVAFILVPSVIEKILRHLGLWAQSAPSPGPPSRGLPDGPHAPRTRVVRCEADGTCLHQAVLL